MNSDAWRDALLGVKPMPPPPTAKPIGIGDWLARLLSALCIKKRSGCGCLQRQEKLNRIGFAAQKLILAPFQKNR